MYILVRHEEAVSEYTVWAYTEESEIHNLHNGIVIGWGETAEEALLIAMKGLREAINRVAELSHDLRHPR